MHFLWQLYVSLDTHAGHCCRDGGRVATFPLPLQHPTGLLQINGVKINKRNPNEAQKQSDPPASAIKSQNRRADSRAGALTGVWR